jgi:translation elongation factor EF-4
MNSKKVGRIAVVAEMPLADVLFDFYSVNGEKVDALQEDHRRDHHRPHEHQASAKVRHRQVLRRRHHPQAKAPREAEKGRMKLIGAGGGPQEAFVAVPRSDKER